MRGGGELENLHTKFKREAVAAKKAAAEVALATKRGGKGGKAGEAGKAGDAGKGKEGGDKAGGAPGGAGGDQQQQDGGDQQALAELDPEQQVCRGGLAGCRLGSSLGWTEEVAGARSGVPCSCTAPCCGLQRLSTAR